MPSKLENWDHEADLELKRRDKATEKGYSCRNEETRTCRIFKVEKRNRKRKTLC